MCQIFHKFACCCNDTFKVWRDGNFCERVCCKFCAEYYGEGILRNRSAFGNCCGQEISGIFSRQSGPWPGSVLSRASQYASNLRRGRWLFGVVDGTSKSAKVRARLHEVEHRKRTGLRSKHDSDIVNQQLVSWSLTSLFSTNMAISETSCKPAKVVNQHNRTNPVVYKNVTVYSFDKITKS